ncbi:MAG: hypothetical protein PHD13_05245 [Methanocellales archaeon]|nr:hypothetical protein [Methanocellales archaeon]MDD3292061.1 hypothetical protein [Methanocellales archaeon]MDD5235558.1 hypothetical protein [Methanocellales archaeon]MDD5485582.1 hypothetical protein [Methanocellales archaeon]
MKNKIGSGAPILAVVPVQVGAVKNYTLTASAEKKEGQITVSGKTNLPDGCVLGVFIERPYWRKGLLVPLDAHEAERMLIDTPLWERGDDTTYTGHMAFGEATVEKGSYEVSLTPDDVGWYDNAIMLIELGLWTDFERISDDLAISVIFTPKRDQPDSVYALLGNNAENMAGEQVEFSGHSNVLKAETTLKVHFLPPSAHRTTSAEKQTPTPAQETSQPEQIKLSRDTPGYTSTFPLESGTSIFRMTYNGSEEFEVVLVNYKEVHPCGAYDATYAVLADEIGPFDGVKTVEIIEPGTYILYISGKGQWSIIIEQS